MGVRQAIFSEHKILSKRMRAKQGVVQTTKKVNLEILHPQSNSPKITSRILNFPKLHPEKNIGFSQNIFRVLFLCVFLCFPTHNFHRTRIRRDFFLEHPKNILAFDFLALSRSNPPSLFFPPPTAVMPRRQVKGNQRGKQQQPKAAEEPKTHSQNLPSKEQVFFFFSFCPFFFFRFLTLFPDCLQICSQIL